MVLNILVAVCLAEYLQQEVFLLGKKSQHVKRTWKPNFKYVKFNYCYQKVDGMKMFIYREVLSTCNCSICISFGSMGMTCYYFMMFKELRRQVVF